MSYFFSFLQDDKKATVTFKKALLHTNVSFFFQSLRQYQDDSNGCAEWHREHQDHFAELFRAAQ